MPQLETWFGPLHQSHSNDNDNVADCDGDVNDDNDVDDSVGGVK